MRLAAYIIASAGLFLMPGCSTTADRLDLAEAYDLCKTRDSDEARDRCVKNFMALKREQRGADLERCDELLAEQQRQRAVAEGFGVEDGRTGQPLPEECGISVGFSTGER
ncbi:hypothetical protein [Parvularcula lutaonensis]|uniref:Lipoprotein n=1 Tax=Parvularcula lutaonensis TaxID=491923 RepID=A0ABV7MDL1_9PROT|nr:hypothetical protein [Parvularcula lutaonensis]GGY53514.1 hypothetical protein GCM10007148_23460 [Parvularcula lutaonensis]